MTTEKEFKKIADQLVKSMVGAEHLDTWWNSPNRAFDNRTPLQQWELGSDSVVNYLMSHAFGRGG
jgi:Protein of unknown function (DUF2384)